MTVSPPRLRLDDEYARLVGAMLHDIRKSSGATLQIVGNALLLSPSQISGLECYELKHFYSARIFAKMLVKYAEYLDRSVDLEKLTLGRGLLVGVEADWDGLPVITHGELRSAGALTAGTDASVSDDQVQLSIAPEHHENSSVLKLSHVSRYSLREVGQRWCGSRRMRISLYGCVGLIGVSAFVEPDTLEALLLNEGSVCQYFVATTDMNPPQILASQVQDATVLKPEGVVQADKRSDVGANESVPSRADLIVLETTKDCWIQLNYADGKSSQRLHPTGARLEFAPGELAGMIIGDVSAARLVVNQTAITLSNYQKPSTNIARLIGQDAVALLGK